MKQLALIGPTASGKTALSIQLAQALDAVILSLDSLALYKEIDIASAKPSLEERAGVRHFGIDLLLPNESFDVTTYVALYREVLAWAQKEEKNLIIVGGTSFYLKILLEGISDTPHITDKTQSEVRRRLTDLAECYTLLSSIDPDTMQQIEPTDSYRIEKMLALYLETGERPSDYFAAHPPEPAITDPLPLYEIVMDRALLRERIGLRSQKMLSEGLIDEVAMLEKRYGRAPQSMKAIGIKETLAYLDGQYDQKTLKEKIAIHTGRLAKRQETFNRSQFKERHMGSAREIYEAVLSNHTP